MGEWKSSGLYETGSPVDLRENVWPEDVRAATLFDAAVHKAGHSNQLRGLEGCVLSAADKAFRWKAGERLDHLFEQRCARFGDSLAVVTESGCLTYQELDRRANQLARFLVDQGVASGDRVGLLLDKGIETYVALLAVLKVNSAYVPFDPGFPEARIQSIVADAGVKAIISMSAFEERLRAFDGRCVYLDAANRKIDAKPHARLGSDEVAPPVNQVCYILYTSGTTGQPKGVVIEHPSICNFVQVAAELYGFVPGDRVYQGMTIAFDFSVEEIWVPLMAGATLVPGKPGTSLVGDELADFLRDQKVTGMACCPTLLATIEQDLPQLRVLLVGGEACPQNLVVRWHRPGRAILNTYGPTEATVTATMAELTPSKPVTIGRPLPTYSIVILDPEADKVVEPGELGEIGIAGIGVAAGYLNRDELSRKKFIADFLEIPNNPSRCIYRTGDLGRIKNGEVECLGRIDSQVKIRGYRIELVEIESILLEIPQIAQAAVSTCETDPGFVEIVAYYSFKQGAELSRGEIAQALRSRLPAYMVPAFLEQLPFIPMLISNKVDHKKLPKPKGPRFTVEKDLVEAKTENERLLAAALAEVLKLDRISVEDHFFNDLGGHSLLMARFCAKIRQNPGTPHVSMRDIYLNPTIAKLASHLEGATIEDFVARKPEPSHVPSDLAYYGCGALQLLTYAAYTLLSCCILVVGFTWVVAADDDPIQFCLRGVAFAAATFFGLTAFAIAGKWLLIGRWKAEAIPVWSLRYFRFWFVKFLVQTAPMAAFVGTPLFNVYLRMLGAKIGCNTVIESRYVPVCTDLFSVGDDTILRKDSILVGYRAQSNFIRTGWINIGNNAFVGEASVLDIDTAMGDDTQLGHASSLQSGQRIPDSKRYHGSPAVPTISDYCPIEHKDCSTLRRGLYSAFLVAVPLALVPVGMFLLYYWYGWFVHLTGLSVANFSATNFDVWNSAFSSLMLLTSLCVFFGSIVLGLVGIYVMPRLWHSFLQPGRTYVRYGLHYVLQGWVSGLSNSRFYNLLFGDTSAIVHYMRFIGWRLNEVEQTGSNFGTNQRHDNPFLCVVGSRTMVSDGLSMINMHASNSSFRLAETRIGERNYLGNDIHYPPDGRTGANCLLGTKVMIPIDGPVREDVGLLGSPYFEIPRIVGRDKEINDAFSGEVRWQRLRRKNAHNAVTAALLLFTRWMFFFAALVIAHLAVLNYQHYGIFSLFVAIAILLLVAIPYFALIERASLLFKRLTPKTVSIYDPYFWSHERHWKLSDSPIMERFAGTPFKNIISRLVGVKIGRKVYDAGCSITDRTLTQVDDLANLNEGSVLQAHSLEEGVFKSDYIRIGRGSTLAPGAFVHYGVDMGEHVVLDADSFLMKGEILDAHTRWRGNPARLLCGGADADPAIAQDVMAGLLPSKTAQALAAE
jgi:non-ribosomal peptide synthetase-like protein